jgi:hypothetical protein
VFPFLPQKETDPLQWDVEMGMTMLCAPAGLGRKLNGAGVCHQGPLHTPCLSGPCVWEAESPCRGPASRGSGCESS